ncbi:MAG: FkbM family methyltransferase [Candidatus Omnitrophica bacterium]|nr:FkbM family methyltransferase [Candidatus Omnitrophota bacterium]
MKKIVRKIIRNLGLEKKSVKTGRLSFYKTKTGNYYLPTDACKDEIAGAIKKGKIFDKSVYEIAKKYVKPGTIAIDMGANFGQMAILMAGLVGNKGAVHAFEADDFVFKVMEKNAKENFSNITAHFGAVHDKSNETLYFPEQDFVQFGSYGSYGIDYIHGKGRPVRTIALDDIRLELPVSFMKIDIEGGELFALKGAIKTINKHRMPIIFEYSSHYEEKLNLSFQECVDFVHKINYRFERIVDDMNYLIVPKEYV